MCSKSVREFLCSQSVGKEGVCKQADVMQGMILMTPIYFRVPHTKEKIMIFFGVLRLRFQRLYRLTYCLAKKEFSRGLCDHKGWDGEGDGREVQKGGAICVPMADSC